MLGYGGNSHRDKLLGAGSHWLLTGPSATSPPEWEGYCQTGALCLVFASGAASFREGVDSDSGHGASPRIRRPYRTLWLRATGSLWPA